MPFANVSPGPFVTPTCGKFANPWPAEDLPPNLRRHSRVSSLNPASSELHEHLLSFKRLDIKPITILTVPFNGMKPSITSKSLKKRFLTGAPFAGHPRQTLFSLAFSWRVTSKADHEGSHGADTCLKRDDFAGRDTTGDGSRSLRAQPAILQTSRVWRPPGAC